MLTGPSVVMVTARSNTTVYVAAVCVHLFHACRIYTLGELIQSEQTHRSAAVCFFPWHHPVQRFETMATRCERLTFVSFERSAAQVERHCEGRLPELWN